MTDNIIKLLENEKASTINNTSYVLFELPKNEEPLNLYDLIYEMQQNKIVPVLAHPERYVYVQKEPELLYDLVEKGVLIQANYGSIIGQYGNKAQMIVRKMFENNLVHFLGTDVHMLLLLQLYTPILVIALCLLFFLFHLFQSIFSLLFLLSYIC